MARRNHNRRPCFGTGLDPNAPLPPRQEDAPLSNDPTTPNPNNRPWWDLPRGTNLPSWRDED